MEIYRRRPISAQLNVTIDIQFRGFELRAPAHTQVGAVGSGVECIVAHTLVVKGKIAPANVRVDDRLLQSAGGLSREIHAAIHAHAAGLQFRNAGKVKVLPSQIETEGMGREVVSTGATDVRVVVREMKIVRTEIASRLNSHLGVQVLNRFASDHCIGEFDVAVSVGLRPGSLQVHQEIGRPTDGEVISADSENFVNIGIVYLDPSRNRARVGKLPFLQAKAEAEIDGCATVMQPAVMCGKGVWR